MTRRNLILVCTGVLCFCMATLAGAKTFAITGGKVYTLGPAGRLERGTIVIRDGKIIAVGAKVPIPADAERIDASGKVVTPGLFDPASQFGVEEVSQVKETRDMSVTGNHFTASFDVADAINPRSTLIPINRIAGVTTAMVSPTVTTGGTVIAGRGTIITLGSTTNFIIRDPAAMFVSFGETGAALAGGSRAAAILYLREALQDAHDYLLNRSAYNSGRRRTYLLGRMDLAALVPVLKGEMPLVVDVERASDIEAALQLVRDFGIKLIISGGAEAWMLAHDLARAHVPVILDPLQDLPGSFEALGSTLTNAAQLDKAGVIIAFETGDSHNARNLTQLAGNAVSYGLPYEEGLKAIMLNPARIYGMADKTGMLKVGMDADIVVWNGDPLEVTSAADVVFIRGRKIPMVSRQTLLRDRYLQYMKNGRKLPPQYIEPTGS